MGTALDGASAAARAEAATGCQRGSHSPQIGVVKLSKRSQVRIRLAGNHRRLETLRAGLDVLCELWFQLDGLYSPWARHAPVLIDMRTKYIMIVLI
jgi:hypothetical protein